MLRNILTKAGILLALTAFASSCASGGHGGIKGQSSQPINKKEAAIYREVIIRCHKTGGTRIVKINNVLRCF